jgi:hypothetical protein
MFSIPWNPNLGWMSTRKKAVSGPFTPLSLTSLKGWYKSDVGVTIVTGVSQWDDQSGNTNHLVQATGGSQPTVTAAAVNGLPALLFDGVDDNLSKSYGTLAQPLTVFLVVRQETWTSARTIVDGKAAAGTMMVLQTGVSPALSLNAGASVANNTNLALASFGLVTAIFNGASSVLQIQNTAETTGDPGAGTPNGLTIGSRANATQFANVSVAEAIVMAASATATERTNMKAYVLARYGI